MLAEGLAAAGFDVRSDDPPTNVSVAGMSGLSVGAIAADPNQPRACWIWMVSDNLRLVAENALAVAKEFPAVRRGFIAAAGVLLLASSCGYHIGGHGDLMPKTDSYHRDPRIQQRDDALQTHRSACRKRSRASSSRAPDTTLLPTPTLRTRFWTGRC